MSALAALLMLQTAPVAADADTILVLAERLEQIDVTVGQDHEGRWHCSLSHSSGSARIDDRFCRSATKCYQKHGNDQGDVLDCLSRSRGNILEDFRRRYERGQQ